MSGTKICAACGKEFIPDKFHPKQRYCGLPECKRERRNKYLHAYGKMYRKLHPGYSSEYKRRRRGME